MKRRGVLPMGKLKQKILQLLRGDQSTIDVSRKRGVQIGRNCRLNGLPNWGSEPWLISIGDHSEISVQVTFLTHDGATWCFREQERYKDVIRYGRIKIGNNCFIGANVTILPNVSIGDDVIVGAGAVVAGDLPSGSVYGGVPAKRICSLEEYAEKVLRETPEYDREAYQRDKRAEVLRVYPER